MVPDHPNVPARSVNPSLQTCTSADTDLKSDLKAASKLISPESIHTTYTVYIIEHCLFSTVLYVVKKLLGGSHSI